MSAPGQQIPATQPTGGSILAAALDEVTNPSREQPPAAAPGQPSAVAPAAPGPIPYDRFKQVNDERAQLAQRIQELENAEVERQRAALSEQERAQQDAQRYQTEAQSNEQRAIRAERALEVWKAAHAAGFRDPDDAVTFLSAQIADLDTAEKVKQAVAELLERKAHLKATGQGGPTPIGLPGHQQRPQAEVPLGADGKPDVKAGLGQDLLANLFGRTRGH